MSASSPDEFEVKKISLPNELPPAPNLSTLTAADRNSPTVDFLLAQNEDLMARLKVQIKKAAAHETELNSLQEKLKLALASRNSLKDRLSIWTEKEKAWKSELSDVEQKLESSAEQLSLLSLQNQSYAETLQTIDQKWQAERQEFRSALLRLTSFRRRIRSWLYPAHRKLQDDNYAFYKKIENLSERLREKTVAFEELTEKFQRQVSQLEEQNRALLQSKDSITGSLQTEVSQLQTQLSEVRSRAKTLQIQADRTDKLENELILEKRSRDRLVETYQAQIEGLQVEKLRLEQLTSELHFKMESSAAEYKRNLETSFLQEQRIQTTALQLEKIRKMWIESQDLLNAEIAKNRDLEKINESLSKTPEAHHFERNLPLQEN